MPYKTVLTLDSAVNEFVDESSINGMNYTFKIVAIDNSGNVSNPSNEAGIGTITIGRPDPPISANANAYEDYINITIVPPELGQDNRDIYTPSEYKIQISKNSGTTYSDVAITANTNYDYYFNRTIDGFPEINVLNKYRFRIYSVNSYGNLSIPITIPVSTGDYQTWIPVVPVNFRGSVTGRTCFLEWDRQNNIFGNIAYRIQISKDSVNWYKPNVSHDPYADEAYWKENNSEGDFLEITSNSFFQIVPLKGQNTVLENGNYKIEPETYYYRIKAVNTSSAVESNYTNDVILEAQGTSAQDILKNSVGWDQIIDKSILVEKLGVKKLIAGESTLAFIGNDVNVSDKTRQGFQYWALDDISINGTTFKKGEFRINSNTGDYFIVDPVNGIFFKASKIEMDALGSKVYGDFSIIDGKAANITQLFFDLIDNDGKVKTIPLITIGNNSKKPEINIYCTTMAINGKMNVVTPDLPWFA
jgi:hypothetical protein